MYLDRAAEDLDITDFAVGQTVLKIKYSVLFRLRFSHFLKHSFA